MCKAFSAIVTKNGDVLWKMGVDSHEEIIRLHNLSDKQLPPDFARVEITPKNGNYLFPDTWVFRLDERATPEWWSPAYQVFAEEAREKWYSELEKMLNKKQIINPLKDVQPPKKITKKHIMLLKKWHSVWQSVEHSVGQSVWQSVEHSVGQSVGQSAWQSVWQSVEHSVGQSVGQPVWHSVGQSVGQSAWHSVWQSVWQSVYAYCGSFFNLPCKSWKYTGNIKCKGYPFQPCVDLWDMGLVPSFDGKTWRLHGGPKADVLFEITAEKLRKSK
jgi:hypothetical protein